VNDFIPGIVDAPLDLDRQMVAALSAWPELIDTLGVEAEDLRTDGNRALLQLMQLRRRAGLNVDPAGLDHAIYDGRQRGQRTAAGFDPRDLWNLWEWVPPSRHSVHSILGDLREHRQRREAKQASLDMQDAVRRGDDAAEIAQQMHASATRLTQLQRSSMESVEAVAIGVLDEVERELSGERAVYIRTGVAEWDDDQDFGGLSAEGVTLFIAASGMGKTSLLNRFAIGLAATGTPVYLHGTETSPSRRVRDLANSLAGISARAWSVAQARGKDRWLEEQATLLRRALRFVAELPLSVSGAGLTVEKVVGKARALHKEGRCGVVIVDYLQDFSRSRDLDAARGAQVDHYSATLKELAADLRVPVVVGAQVSGEKAGVAKGTKAPTPIPQMWDTQWSSKAHQDAEEIYALYRDDYYVERIEGWTRKGAPNEIEVHARKRRDGCIGKLRLDFVLPGKWVGSRLRERGQ